MGYVGGFSIWTRCVSECFATMTFVFFMQCILANKLLPQTKAADISFAWIAFGIGIAVFIPVQFFGFVSASLNPASTLAAAISQKIDWQDYPFLCASQLLGAFFASILMWIYFLPHIETHPSPRIETTEDPLLHRDDAIRTEGLDFISYNTKAEEAYGPPGLGIMEFGRLLSFTPIQRANRFGPTPSSRRVEERDDEAQLEVVRRCNTMDFAEERIQSFSGKSSLKSRLNDSALRLYTERSFKNDTVINIELSSQRDSKFLATGSSAVYGSAVARAPGTNTNEGAHDHSLKSPEVEVLKLDKKQHAKEKDINHQESKNEDKANSDTKIMASRVADQNMKLSLFCTRPARYFPLYNLLTEIISTFYLAIGMRFIDERSTLLSDGYSDVYIHGQMAFLDGMWIFLLVLSLGGLGISMNPARDLGPRFAHWILPIQGKGSSEWYYAWIPTVGPLIGGAFAGVIFRLVKSLSMYENSQEPDSDQLNVLRSGLAHLLDSCTNITKV